jgi:hypothetical protein
MGTYVDAFIWYGFNDYNVPDVINPNSDIEHENKSEWGEYSINGQHITPISDNDNFSGWGVVLFCSDRNPLVVDLNSPRIEVAKNALHEFMSLHGIEGTPQVWMAATYS